MHTNTSTSIMSVTDELISALFTNAPLLFNEALNAVDKCSVWRSRERSAEGETLRAWTRQNVDTLRNIYHRKDMLSHSARPTVGCLLVYSGLD